MVFTDFNKDSKIYIAGHTGLIGSAIVRKLRNDQYRNLITRYHYDLDLKRQTDVEAFFKNEKPDYVILAAARVGGIFANNTYPAEFIYENLMIQNNVIHSSFLNNVKKLLFFGSACSYPRDCPQPMRERHLLTGIPESTNEPYAVAKIAGIKMCQSYNKQYGTDYICALLTNAYGINDNFDPDDSHVIPSLIRKFHEAKLGHKKEVIIWGTGLPRREFIYADDAADASLFLLKLSDGPNLVNVGSGEEIRINELAIMVKNIVGFDGKIVFDESKPDGAPRKVLDGTIMESFKWKARTSLFEGIRETYHWYTRHNEGIRGQ